MVHWNIIPREGIMKDRWYAKFFPGLVTSLILLSLIGSPQGIMFSPSTGQMDGKNTIRMLQFTSGGHILGFSSTGVYAATGNHALHVDFVGAQNVLPQAELPATDGKAVPLERVNYPNLWQGISLTYDAPPGGIFRSIYQLDPGADVRTIRLRYNVPLAVNRNGSLTIAFNKDVLNESAPLAWQVINGRQVAVVVNFTYHNAEVGFTLGKYDPRYPLTIDPMLTWNTFLGGSSTDEGGNSLVVDGLGNVYVVGASLADWGCSPTPCTVRAFSGGEDGFVAKLDPNGALIWNTFLGSSGYVEHTFGIALNGNVSVYVTGWSTWEWSGAGSGAYVAKLNTSDGVLQWSTFFPYSIGSAIAVDGSGSVFVAGQSFNSWGCPNPVKCTIRPFTSGTHYSEHDGFVAKLDTNGVLLWNTFLGGSGEDWGNGIAVDNNGYVYASGGSEAAWGTPVRPYNPGDGDPSNIRDAFAVKLNATTGVLKWSTFLGGSGNEGSSMIYQVFRGVAVDETGNVFLVGDSSSAWSCVPVACTVRAFTTNTMFQGDAYVAKLNSYGVLKWNTFLGGQSDDEGSGIAVDGSGNIYAAGTSPNAWGSPFPGFTVGDEAFAVKLNSSGAIQWSAFLGGKGSDQGNDITVDGGGGVYVTGITDYLSWGVPVRDYSAEADIFVAKITNTANKRINFNSIGLYDGWILESIESSNVGGTLDNLGTTFFLGDAVGDKQYRAILSFETSNLPDSAVITKATLKIKKQGLVGTNPFTILGDLKADIRSPFFGTTLNLLVNDFQATVSKAAVGTFVIPPVNNWYSASIGSVAFPYINRTGTTQFRLYFTKDDNDDNGADYVNLFSGDYTTASDRPTLIIEYYVP
jgi:hypothetical protein